jgi:hypothetical protein
VIERSKNSFFAPPKDYTESETSCIKTLYFESISPHTNDVLDTDGFERAIPRVVKGQTMHWPAQEALAKDSSLTRKQSVPE